MTSFFGERIKHNEQIVSEALAEAELRSQPKPPVVLHFNGEEFRALQSAAIARLSRAVVQPEVAVSEVPTEQATEPKVDYPVVMDAYRAGLMQGANIQQSDPSRQ